MFLDDLSFETLITTLVISAVTLFVFFITIK